MKSVIIIIILISIILTLLMLKLFFYYSSEIVYVHRDRNENKIALTFDDGPSDKTLEIIKILKEENVTATFFVIGKNIEENPDLFKKLVDSGNEIGNHGYSHLRLNLKTRKTVADEIKATDNLLASFNVSNDLFRPSHGSISIFLDSASRKMQKKIIKWDVNSRDYKNPGTDKIFSNVLKNVKSGSIIVFHDWANNKDALKILIPELKKKYQLVGVSELF